MEMCVSNLNIEKNKPAAITHGRPSTGLAQGLSESLEDSETDER